jgi:hypothetical protein
MQNPKTIRILSVGVVAVAVLSATAAAAQQRHGGALAPHVSAPAPHISAPAAPHVSAPAPHFSAPAPHFSAPAARFNAPRPSAPHISAAPRFSAPAHVASPRSSAPRGTARTLNRPTARGNVAHAPQPTTPTSRQAQSQSRRTSGSTVGNAQNAERNVGRNAITNNNLRNPTDERARNATARAVHNALAARPVREALRNPSQLRDPRTRTQVAAAAATAGWRDHHGDHHEWWRHRHGGFGWVGPLFWPFAYYDFYDYAFWGDGYDYAFWDYGSDDIYAALFAPYDYDELAGYLPGEAVGAVPYAARSVRGRRQASITGPSELTAMCGNDTRNIAGLPIDQIQQALHPDDRQQAALDELANASAKAAQVIKTACPTNIALTAPGRIEAMQRRVEAMTQAVEIVQPKLDTFYSLLSDEQKARLTGLGEEQNRNRSTGEKNANIAVSTICGPPQTALTNWPTDAIVQAVRPNETQRAALDELKDAAAQATETVQASCPGEPPLTPPARLAAVHERLDAMLSAIRTVRGALNRFYASLSDEQKAQFDAIGPRRSATG